MARFMRLEVINTLLEIGLLPLFYHEDLETSIEVVSACSRGGAKVIEFTNRGEFAYPVFTELVKHFSKADPSIILGKGSVVDAPTAGLYITAGANFIVGPNFNPEIAKLCNRRKILYNPVVPPRPRFPLLKNMVRRFAKSSPAKPWVTLRSSRRSWLPAHGTASCPLAVWMQPKPASVNGSRQARQRLKIKTMTVLQRMYLIVSVGLHAHEI